MFTRLSTLMPRTKRSRSVVLQDKPAKSARLDPSVPVVTRIYFCVTEEYAVEGYIFTTASPSRSADVHAHIMELKALDDDAEGGQPIRVFDFLAFLQEDGPPPKVLGKALNPEDWVYFNGVFLDRPVTSIVQYAFPSLIM